MQEKHWGSITLTPGITRESQAAVNLIANPLWPERILFL
jgi:hypothetical protein